eukprot:CAMPEP_0114548076 /NCGR_PEP_ID=MMETSP0114-20121206/4788_1 /TAXON_ID=31324 /ORGANISM="Goniomonas sp, Strain m" /LENGTH=407 /DNA_ID=CAMNT_0001732641 /DNA_START=28 /DNA_END=1248 /DNA_ORIENTATION=-
MGCGASKSGPEDNELRTDIPEKIFSSIPVVTEVFEPSSVDISVSPPSATTPSQEEPTPIPAEPSPQSPPDDEVAEEQEQSFRPEIEIAEPLVDARSEASSPQRTPRSPVMSSIPASPGFDFEMWTSKASTGDLKAKWKLAHHFLNGDGVARDLNQAVVLLQEVADSGSAQACHELGVCLMADKHKRTVSFQYFSRAAELGDPAGQRMLARCYEEGRGVERNSAEGLKWFRKSAENGDALSMVLLAHRLEQVDPPDFIAVASWYLKAAELGNAEAQRCLGNLYAVGTGVDMDLAQAARWWTAAAEQGDGESQCNMGLVYRHGYVGREDAAQAHSWYTRASLHGHPDAYAFLEPESWGLKPTHGEHNHWCHHSNEWCSIAFASRASRAGTHDLSEEHAHPATLEKLKSG